MLKGFHLSRIKSIPFAWVLFRAGLFFFPFRVRTPPSKMYTEYNFVVQSGYHDNIALCKIAYQIRSDLYIWAITICGGCLLHCLHCTTHISSCESVFRFHHNHFTFRSVSKTTQMLNGLPKGFPLFPQSMRFLSTHCECQQIITANADVID